MRLSRRSVLALGGAAAVGVGASFMLPTSRADVAHIMTPQEAFQAAERGEILLVDIRRPDEWAATGVPAPAVPIDMRARDFIEQVSNARAFPAQPVAVICARGVRSARVTRQLEAVNLTPIIDVPEGMLGSRAGPGWLKTGLPVRTQ
ncbi:rhodanese-like domain-containing protein [Shimia sp. R9_1]|nr:rhodanese-like domain-containing protein [Shimia sp. R9_1]MBO9409265.1 rhodanese-like domain-containing protein [Shimia sp. R9_1]